MMQKKKFTVPVLCKGKKEWYVFFEFTHNDKVYKRKIRGGINAIKDKRERTATGEALAAARYEWLKSGWNPVTDPQYRARNIVQPEKAVKMSVPEALKWAHSKQAHARKTMFAYSSMLSFFVSAAKSLFYDSLQITDFKRFHVKSLLEQVGKDREAAYDEDKKTKGKKISNHALNKYKNCLSAFLTILR